MNVPHPTPARALLVCLAAAALPVLVVPAVRATPGASGASPASGAPAPSAEASLAGDGPQVVEADPFTMDAPGLAPGQIEMTTVSTRPTLVTGDRARVQVRGVEPDDRLVVTADGRDTSGAFAPVPSRPGQALGIREGLVAGLAPGTNRLVATVADAAYGTRSTTLTVIDHPIAGPVISGPHQYPFVCQTQASGLGAPTDRDCSAPTSVAWYARKVTGQYVQLSDPYGPLPPGTASTDDQGRTVPFVVRVESAVINRSITRIAVLDDPAARGPDKPFTAGEWNRHLLYQFGESCGTGFTQGSNRTTDTFGQLTAFSSSDIAGPSLDLTGHLGEGWMVAESTLTTFGVSCNPATSAETLMMAREHIVDDYGDIVHTVGAGASGGAIQQYLAANNYPGLVDAGTPLFSFPDILSTAMTVTDCTLLNHAFAADHATWSSSRQDAVTGERSPQVCQDWESEFGSDLNPASCPSGIPPGEVYNANTNPNGVRCDLEDDDVNLLGRDPSTGRANLPLDNTGVQYGLEALRAGSITPAQFIELNRAVGGFDHDGNIVRQRNAVTGTEAALVYQSGEVTGTGALPDAPMIDQSLPVGDFVPALDIHQQVWPYVMQARLRAAGDSSSQVIWSGVPLPANAIDVANDWLGRLDALESSRPGLSRAELVARSRPAVATDQCRAVATGVAGPCDQGVLRGGNPRQEAGGPLSMDDVACRLRPVRASDYPPGLTRAQLAAIRGLFSSGVCDFSKPASGARTHSSPWLSYGSTTLSNPPFAVPYPLVRSSVPVPRPGTPVPPGAAGAAGGPAPSPLAPLLDFPLGPLPPAGSDASAAGRAASTVIDAAP